MKYNNIRNRYLLADTMKFALLQEGFSESRFRWTLGHPVFTRKATPRVDVCVTPGRDVGSTIQVYACYMRDCGTPRRLDIQYRVNRTGEIPNIIHRLVVRVNRLAEMIPDMPVCSDCGAMLATPPSRLQILFGSDPACTEFCKEWKATYAV